MIPRKSFRSIVGFASALLVLLAWATSSAAENLRIYQPGEKPNDIRLGTLKDLNGYFPFVVPADKDAWEQRAAELRRRVLVATGLWPLPERTSLNPVIHGKVQRDGFTVEKVYFESIPNHFVTGLLFRPDDGKEDLKRPAILCPHGHGGRLQDHGPEKILELLTSGDEVHKASGRMPKIARCAHLARMGVVTFIFDMLGYADSQQISTELSHRFGKQRPDFEGKESWGLFSAQAEMRMQSIMGLQTWNSIRCLDFLQQLPDVDPRRIGVTGGSGGGTQTILLCAIDDRPIVGFPNGMVSTSMQGGCTCENCALLRIGTGNVELAALFAPKPQGMTAANDWTRDMLTKGFPQLQEIYAAYGAKENVFCGDLLRFPHNYNYVTRAMMYAWMNEHLSLNADTKALVENDFVPLSKEDYTVWNAKHPQPPGGDEYERELTAYLAQESDQQIAALTPTDAKSRRTYRETVGGAWETIIGREIPQRQDTERKNVLKQPRDGYIYFEDIIRLKTHGEELPVINLFPTRTAWNKDVVIWVDGKGKQALFADGGKLHPRAQRLLDKGTSISCADLFLQGDFLGERVEQLTEQRLTGTREAAAYTFGYNHPLFAQRVHDVLTLIAYVRDDEHGPERVHLLGINGGGPLALAARAIVGPVVDSAFIDTQGFRFQDVKSLRDPSFLPGAVKYGDMGGLMALNSPHELVVHGETKLPEVASASYKAAGAADKLVVGDSPSF